MDYVEDTFVQAATVQEDREYQRLQDFQVDQVDQVRQEDLADLEGLLLL